MHVLPRPLMTVLEKYAQRVRCALPQALPCGQEAGWAQAQVSAAALGDAAWRLVRGGSNSLYIAASFSLKRAKAATSPGEGQQGSQQATVAAWQARVPTGPTRHAGQQTQVWQPRYRDFPREAVDRRLCDPGFRSGVP